MVVTVVNDPVDWASQLITYWIDYANMDRYFKDNLDVYPSFSRQILPVDGKTMLEFDRFTAPAEPVIDLEKQLVTFEVNPPLLKDYIGNTSIELQDPLNPLRSIYFKV